MRSTLIVHERLARWTRRLRPRVDRWGARLVESRSIDDLAAASAAACPVVLIDPAGNPRTAFEALLTVRRTASQALVLVIEDAMPPDFHDAAREAGATLVLPSTSPLPFVFDLVHRWLELAAQRAEADGWTPRRETVAEPWEAFLPSNDETILPSIPQRTPNAL